MPITRPNLADPATRAARRALLAEPHAAPLAAYVEGLRRATPHYVPDIDPLDGGTATRLLFILEKPGPRVVPPAGSGFVSRDTDDPTARAIDAFMREAGIPRAATLLWNTCPWWTGAIATSPAEFRAGAATLPSLLALLPQLAAAVLVGNAASRYAEPMLPAVLPRFRTVHPGGQARAGPASAERWRLIPSIWRRAWLASSAATACVQRDRKEVILF